MANVRRDFPQWISPVNSFSDAVNILKSKRILTEADAGSHGGPIGGESNVGARHIANMWNNLDSATRDSIVKGTSNQDFDTMMKALPPGSIPLNKLYAAIKQAAEDESMISQMQAKSQGEFDPSNPGKHSILEAAQKPEGAYKRATGKAEYDKFAEMDRVHYGQLVKGMEYELLKMSEISDENLVKAKKKAYSNLIKDPKYYMHLLIANEKDVEKRDKDLRMQPVKEDNKVDKPNAMKVIKKDEGANTKENLGNKEKAKGKPEGVKEMPDKGVIGTEKVLRESLVKQLREEIMDEMIELGTAKKNFSKGQKVETPDGEVGTVQDESPDSTCTVVMDDGTEKHYQANVLKAHEGEQMQEDNQPNIKWPDLKGEWNGMSPEERVQSLKQNRFLGKKPEDTLKAIANLSFDELYNYDTPARKQHGIPPYAALLQGLAFPSKVQEEDKHAALKEKLMNGLKKEAKTAKTGNPTQDQETLRKINRVQGPGKEELKTAFNRGQVIDI